MKTLPQLKTMISFVGLLSMLSCMGEEDPSLHLIMEEGGKLFENLKGSASLVEGLKSSEEIKIKERVIDVKEVGHKNTNSHTFYSDADKAAAVREFKFLSEPKSLSALRNICTKYNIVGGIPLLKKWVRASKTQMKSKEEILSLYHAIKNPTTYVVKKFCKEHDITYSVLSKWLKEIPEPIIVNKSNGNAANKRILISAASA